MNYKYPCVSDNVKLFYYPQNDWYIKVYSENDVKTWTIKQDAVKILKLCNGTNNIKNIYRVLINDYNITTNDFKVFIKEACKREILVLSDKKTNKKELNIVGDGKVIFPQHVTIEITSRCNLRCVYCYNDSCTENKQEFKFSEIKKIFKILQKNGVTEIELSGGEPLMHPCIENILREAFFYFEKIAILTNGVLIDDKLLDLILGYKNKFIGFQVSIDGFTEEVASKLRGVVNSHHKTIYNIRKLIKRELLSRVSMVITEDNIGELDRVCELMRELKFSNFSISIASSIGRGAKLQVEDELFEYRDYIRKKYGEYLQRINKLYSDIFIHHRILNKIEKEKTYNCGAGWRNMCIQSNGDIKICPTDTLVMGNIFDDDIQDIFNSDKGNVYMRFSMEPYLIDRVCDECEITHKCGACISRIVEMNRRRKEKEMGFCSVFLTSGLFDMYHKQICKENNENGIS